jgi:hypothetical protein
MMKSPMVKNPKDLLGGLLFIGFGAFFAWFGVGYDFVRDLRSYEIGPGYFPTILGITLAFLGLGICFLSLKPANEGESSAFAWKALAVCTAALVVFAVVVQPAGVVPAVIALVLISARASIRFRWATAIPLALGLAAFSWFVFVRQLGLPLQAFGRWFGSFGG